MDKERAGPRVIKYFSKAVNLIVKMITFTTGREDISIDDFLPIMVYLFISVGPINVISNFGSATYFLLSDEENENTGYSLANIEGCINFIKQYDPEYVLVLSGDHIYKMDYAKMLQYHKEHNADVTIAAYEVTLEEATRFGVLNTTDDLKIYEFEEKPKQPKSTHASMGIYIFNANTLYKYLEEDEADNESENDFGKNIIPNMLNDGLAMYAYPFRGYWKDVGTISSLWEANMDLLGSKPKLDIHDSNWEIYSRSLPLPPQKISEGSVVKNSLITLGCYIQGTVINSLIGSNVTIKPGAVVKDSVIFENAIVAEDTFIGEGAVVGDESQITVIGPNVKVYDEQTVSAGAMVEKDVK